MTPTTIESCSRIIAIIIVSAITFTTLRVLTRSRERMKPTERMRIRWQKTLRDGEVSFKKTFFLKLSFVFVIFAIVKLIICYEFARWIVRFFWPEEWQILYAQFYGDASSYLPLLKQSAWAGCIYGLMGVGAVAFWIIVHGKQIWLSHVEQVQRRLESAPLQ
jgi:hypothetical protein